MESQRHIHPIFDRILASPEKEDLLKQRGLVIWMTGLSGSGKSTIAIALERKLHENGFLTQVLDGDNVRTGINNNLGFSVEDRTENIRRIAEVSKLFSQCGIICINSFVSPLQSMRNQAAEIIGKNKFVEVCIDTPLEECEKRDVKGLYKKARAGEIKNFTGIDDPFEAPLSPDISISTVGKSIEECVDQLYNYILPKISYS